MAIVKPYIINGKDNHQVKFISKEPLPDELSKALFYSTLNSKGNLRTKPLTMTLVIPDGPAKAQAHIYYNESRYPFSDETSKDWKTFANKLLAFTRKKTGKPLTSIPQNPNLTESQRNAAQLMLNYNSTVKDSDYYAKMADYLRGEKSIQDAIALAEQKTKLNKVWQA